MTDIEKSKILKLRKDGLKPADIAEKLKLPRTTVQSFLSRNRTSAPRPVKTRSANKCKHCGMGINVVQGHRAREFCSDYCRLRYWRSQRNMSRVQA